MVKKISGELVRWGKSADYDKIPDDVKDIVKLQILGMFASAFSALKTDEGKRFLNAALSFSSEGDFPVPGSDKKVSFKDALNIYSGLSMVLDYDDYLFMGHTGHSAVWVSLLSSVLNKKDIREFITSVVIGNEAGGRVGGSLLLGEQNGQMWSYIHGINAVLIHGRLSNFTFETILGALGNYLYQPHFPLYPGFMGSESKIFTASDPILSGIKALEYSSMSIEGFSEIIEHEKGFLNNFSYYPLDFMFTGFGESWITKTLAVKKYPGCAYIDTAIDAILKILKDAKDNGIKIDETTIEEIVVNANLLTVEMDNLAQEYFKPNKLSPININFNLRLNIAIAILAKNLKPEFLTSEYLSENKTRIFSLAGRTKIRHDLTKTFDLIYTVFQSMNWEKLIESVDIAKLREAGDILINKRGSTDLEINLKTLLGLRSKLRGDKRKFLQKVLINRLSNIISRGKSAEFTLKDIDFDKFKMPFGVDVKIVLKDGREFNNTVNIPDGVSYDENFRDIVINKFFNEISPFVNNERLNEFVELIDNIDETTPDDILNKLFE